MFFKNNIDKYFQRFQVFYLHSLTIYLINTYIYSHIYWSSSRCDKITSHGEYKTIKIYIIYTISRPRTRKIETKKISVHSPMYIIHTHAYYKRFMFSLQTAHQSQDIDDNLRW